MPDPHANDAQPQFDVQPETKKQERRTEARSESVLGQIEEATYAIMRKHEEHSA